MLRREYAFGFFNSCMDALALLQQLTVKETDLYTVKFCMSAACYLQGTYVEYVRWFNSGQEVVVSIRQAFDNEALHWQFVQ